LCHPPELECSNSNTSCTLSRWAPLLCQSTSSLLNSIVNNLAAGANLVAEFDLVSTLLNGLSPQYDSFVTSINTRVDYVLLEELIGLMLSQEIYRRHAITSSDSTTLISSPMVHTASRTPSYHSAPISFCGRGHGQGREHDHGHRHFFSPPHQSAGGRPQYQICNRFGHYANQFYNHYDDLSPSASLTVFLNSYGNSTVDPNWYVDSGATHYLMANMENLTVH